MTRRRLATVGAAGAAAVAIFAGGLTTATISTDDGDQQRRDLAASVASLEQKVEALTAAVCSATVNPGGSWDAAYRAAAPGDTICLGAGTHPFVQLNYDASKTGTSKVVFQPAGGAVTVTGGLQSGKVGSSTNVRTGAANWEVRDVKFTGDVKLRWGSDGVVLRNIDAPAFIFHSSKDIQVLGGDWGPSVGGISSITTCSNSPCPGVSNILIDGAFFHDYLIADPADHAECLMIWPNRASSGITVKNSNFRNCTDFGVLVKAPSLSNVTFDTVTLDEPEIGTVATVGCNPNCPRGGTSLRFSAFKYANSKVANSRMAGNLTIDVAGGVVVTNTCSKCDPGGVTPPPTTTTTEPPPTTTEPPPTTTEPPPTTTEPPPTTTEPPPTTSEPPPPTDRSIFCNEVVPNAQAESNYAKWLTQNPGEKSRWEPYRNAVCAGNNPTPPTMLTAKGRSLVASGKMTG